MNDATPIGAASAGRQLNWTATMIRPLSDKGVGTRASFLRKTFTLSSRGGAETLRISALGLYRAFINGQRVGDERRLHNRELAKPPRSCRTSRLCRWG